MALICFQTWWGHTFPFLPCTSPHSILCPYSRSAQLVLIKWGDHIWWVYYSATFKAWLSLRLLILWVLALVLATCRRRNGWFCIAVGPVTRTADILAFLCYLNRPISAYRLTRTSVSTGFGDFWQVCHFGICLGPLSLAVSLWIGVIVSAMAGEETASAAYQWALLPWLLTCWLIVC